MSRRDRVLAAIAALAGLAGIGVSIYLTVVHYSAVPLVCSTTGVVSCERVLSSPYSVIAGSGLPTSAAGILWFGVSAAVAAAQLAGRDPLSLLRFQLAWASIGLATVLFLVFVEITQLGAICIWCTTAHVLVILTFLAVLTRIQSAGAGDPGDQVGD
jgi:uncharacterized membrane protein